MPQTPVPPALDRAASYAWRLLVIAGAIAVIGWSLGRIAVVIGAAFLALILARGLTPIAKLLRKMRLGAGPAAALSLLLFMALSAGIIAAATATVAGQSDSLADSLDTGAKDIEKWITSLSIVDVDRSDLERIRKRATESITNIGSSGGGSALAGAMTVGKLLVGLLLALIVSFFFLKDGPAFRTQAVDLLPPRHRALATDAANRSWDALGGYLRGSALLGVIESLIFGLTLAVTGSSLIAPVMIFTFIAAFVPIIGAIAVGVVAVLVALATAGATAALVMAGVALVVQQLDNDLLAPVLYGRALRLHPLVVLIGVAAGGSAFGLAGSICAVPVLAVLSGVREAFRQREMA